MTIPGRVQNGVVVLESGSILPEGAVVTVIYPTSTRPKPDGDRKRVQIPLVRTGRPGTVNLTEQQIAELLDEEDVAPRH